METALADVRVLDLTHKVAGPYCTKLLADFGADVVKIEPPNGDPARRTGPFFHDDPHPEKSGLFLYLNTNKRSVTLNLKTATGRKLLKDLMRHADLLVENFEPRVPPGLGLDYETLAAVNPRLVMVSISTFGQTGPYRDYKATELTAYAMSAYMYSVGEHDLEPVRHGGYQAEYLGGSQAAVAALTGLHFQRETGIGQHIDMAIIEAVNSVTHAIMPTYAYQGAVMRRQAKAGGSRTLTRVKDGWVSPTLPAVWEEFTEFVGAPELQDPRFATPAGRTAHSVEIESILNDWYAQQERYPVFHAASKRRFIFGVLQTTEDLVNCPQLAAREYFANVEHPMTGLLTYPGAPAKLSETPWRVERPAPLLGQHNREILCGELGYSAADVVRLRQRGIV